MTKELKEQLTEAIKFKDRDYLAQLSYDVCADSCQHDKTSTLALIEACTLLINENLGVRVA
jgi:hypothetical protein